jgi:hypothetical protein
MRISPESRKISTSSNSSATIRDHQLGEAARDSRSPRTRPTRNTLPPCGQSQVRRRYSVLHEHNRPRRRGQAHFAPPTPQNEPVPDSRGRGQHGPSRCRRYLGCRRQRPIHREFAEAFTSTVSTRTSTRLWWCDEESLISLARRIAKRNALRVGGIIVKRSENIRKCSRPLG